MVDFNIILVDLNDKINILRNVTIITILLVN